MSALRFCFLTTFYPPHNFGGDGVGVQRLARGLVRRGHRVTVVHDVDAYRALAGGADPAPTAEPDGLEVIRLRSRWGRLSPLLTQQTGRPVVHGRTIRRLLADGRYDVVNFHNVSLVGGPDLLRYGREAVRVYMAHEHWLVCPTHVLWRHGREVCTGRQCLRCTMHYRRPPQLWRYTGLLDRRLDEVDAFIAMSEFSRRKHQEFGFRREMEVLPYFLPEEPTADGDAAPAERPYFLFVGRLEKIKGLDDVLPLFAGADGPDLVVAGDGEYAATLRRRAEGSPRIKFLGRVPLETLSGYYRRALGLVVPSVCFETFGIILIEAFRQGTPVVARRIGPFPEIVATAGAGELFGTPEELAAALGRLAADPGLRSRYAAAGRGAFRDHWSEEAVVPGYLDIVRRAAARRGHTRVLDALTTQEVA